MKAKVKGVLLFLLSAAIIALASQGTTRAEKDITPVFLLIPLGIQQLVTRESAVHTADGSRHEYR